MNLLEQLKRRKLVQWTVGYLAGGWVLLQVLALLSDSFEWSRTVMQVATVAVALGGVAVMILAWYHGDRGHQRMTALEAVLLVGVVALAGITIAGVVRPDSEGRVQDGAPDAASVAVLPFVNMSNDREQDYFGDGITEEIQNVLAKIPGLRVPGRTSSFAFKNSQIPIREIAAQLNVAHILEGSIRKSGDQLRITAQLIDARKDQHLWSETFDRQATDVFAVQEEIARAVATRLQLQIRTLTDEHLKIHRTHNARAHEEYLRALYYWHRRHEDELHLAVRHLQAAIREDPNFAPAHAGLALTYAVLPQYSDVDPTEYARAGKAAAQRALRLNPQSAHAHAALGQIAQEYDWDWAAAEQHYLTAQKLDPNYATVHQWRAETLTVLGRFDEALREIEVALSLDPLSTVIQHARAFVWAEQGRVEEAMQEYENIIKRDPAFDPARSNLVILYAEFGRVDDAWRLLGRDPDARIILDGVRGDARQRARALAALSRDSVRAAIGSVVGLASIYMSMGVRDSAMAVLNHGVDAREPSIGYAGNARIFRPLQTDPRFQEFRRKIRLPR